MKATETKLLEFLKGPKQFLIPIYQRTYSWHRKQCDKLWTDIIQAASDAHILGHFVGSIVYIEKGLYQISSIPQLLVIDGQQRLTTLAILISALGKALEQRGVHDAISKRKLDTYFLFNNEEEDPLRHKLILTQSDHDTLCSLLEGRQPPELASQQLIDNYHFFEQKLKHTHLDLHAVYQGLAKLFIVDIALCREHDNPQLIFESLNATGLELSQADLIRNFVLMGQEPPEQSRLYSQLWYPMERRFANCNSNGQFGRFVRDYLTMKTRHPPNMRGVYEAFKSHVQHSPARTPRELVADIAKYSHYFVYMTTLAEPDAHLRRTFTNLNTLRADVAYPLLLALYCEYAEQRLTHEDFAAILETIECYLFRRSVCNIATAYEVFMLLLKNLDRAAHLESILATLLLQPSRLRFPNDSEFTAALIARQLYRFRNLKYLLAKMENHNRKEHVNIDDYTVEHIMPQTENLSKAWRDELGDSWEEIHAHYLHTLGNLTLTGYNSELSDRPFIHKREMVGGFADSPIRMNRGLASLDGWNEREIQHRATELASLAKEVWPYPQLDPVVRERYRKRRKVTSGRTYTLRDHPCLTAETLDLFEQLRIQILTLDVKIAEKVRKEYIAYKLSGNVAKVYPRKGGLRVSLGLSIDELDDPQKRCRKDGTGHKRKERVALNVSSIDDIEYSMYLMQQVLTAHQLVGESCAGCTA